MNSASQDLNICRYTYRFIMTKTVALSDEAYGILDAARQPSESFSKAVIRIVKGRRQSLMDLCGMWRGVRELEGIYLKILKDRRKYVPRELRL